MTTGPRRHLQSSLLKQPALQDESGQSVCPSGPRVPCALQAIETRRCQIHQWRIIQLPALMVPERWHGGGKVRGYGGSWAKDAQPGPIMDKQAPKPTTRETTSGNGAELTAERVYPSPAQYPGQTRTEAHHPRDNCSPASVRSSWPTGSTWAPAARDSAIQATPHGTPRVPGVPETGIPRVLQAGPIMDK